MHIKRGYGDSGMDDICMACMFFRSNLGRMVEGGRMVWEGITGMEGLGRLWTGMIYTKYPNDGVDSPSSSRGGFARNRVMVAHRKVYEWSWPNCLVFSEDCHIIGIHMTFNPRQKRRAERSENDRQEHLSLNNATKLTELFLIRTPFLLLLKCPLLFQSS